MAAAHEVPASAFVTGYWLTALIIIEASIGKPSPKTELILGLGEITGQLAVVGLPPGARWLALRNLAPSLLTMCAPIFAPVLLVELARAVGIDGKDGGVACLTAVSIVLMVGMIALSIRLWRPLVLPLYVTPHQCRVGTWVVAGSDVQRVEPAEWTSRMRHGTTIQHNALDILTTHGRARFELMLVEPGELKAMAHLLDAFLVHEPPAEVPEALKKLMRKASG